MSAKDSYELLRVRISKLQKDVFELKVKAGLAKAEPDPLPAGFQDSTGDGV